MDITFLEIAARGIVPPALVAAAFLVAAWKPWRRSGPGGGPRTAWGPPLAVGLGYAVGHVAADGWPPLALQVGVKPGLFYVAVAAAFVGLHEAARRPVWWSRVLVAVGLPVYLLDFMRQHYWSGREAWLWTLGLGGALFVGWSGLERLARRQPGPALSLCWMLAATLTSVALFLSGTATLAQLAGVLATVLGVAAVIGWRRPELSLAPGGTTSLALVFTGLLWAGHFASELTGPATLLLAVAPFAPALLHLPGIPDLRGWKNLALRMLFVAVPAGLAVALEFADRPPSNPYY